MLRWINMEVQKVKKKNSFFFKIFFEGVLYWDDGVSLSPEISENYTFVEYYASVESQSITADILVNNYVPSRFVVKKL
jgi:hypothetical protein